MTGRRCEVLGADGRWAERDFASLRPGDVFRLFDLQTGAPVADDAGCRRWRALSAPAVGEDGRPVVESEAVPETDVERAAREGAVWWSGSGSRRFAPSRLR